MRLRKSFMIAGAGVAATSLLAACAGGAATSATTTDGSAGGDTVTFRGWAPIDPALSGMIDAFESANPGTTIDATVMGGPDYWVDLAARVSSNTMSDIVGLMPGAQTQQYRDYLMPLNECAASQWGDDWEDKFYPIALDQARLGNPDGDDNFYGLPVLTQIMNIWANTEIMDETGAEIPQTWADLEAVTPTYEGNGFTPFLLGAKQYWLNTSIYLELANNINPGLVYEAEDGTVPWTDPDLVKAFEYWQKLFTDGIAQEGANALEPYPDAVGMFEAGDALFLPLGSQWIQQSDPTADQSTIADLSKGMNGYEPFLFPTIPGGADSPQYVGGAEFLFGISKNSQNPELACQVLTDWIAGAGGQVLINTLFDLPAVKGLEPQVFTSDKQEEIFNELANEWLPQVQYSRYFKDPAIETAVSDALAAVATGSMTPQEAAESVQEVYDGL
ncbi:extracellular solute-binding protein [Actinotalea sp. M2MS4P-6]|uniref:ABC transporter substrate-binding protein n=1 Tax=Actinotalea sp. M2MS4P-6 TaxID=2983762 RepID=UPI0021E4F1A4|nr:extracellular solute-binding protein [Actinotalea sp. M2MS4P-6]MCV2395133.1 extracellular solute-binding protein [Actinotalea sp. M2MS4P-6]